MDKQSDALLSIGVKLVAEGLPATYKTLQAQCGQSLKSIRQTFREWQQELIQQQLGQRETNKPNICALITDYAIFVMWKKFLQALDEEEKKNGDPLELLKAFIQRVIELLHQDPAMIRVITSGIPSWAVKKPRRFSPHQTECWGRLLKAVILAQERGLLDRKDPSLLLRILHGAMHQTLYGLALREAVNENYTPEDLIDTMGWLVDRLGVSPRSSPTVS